VTVEEQRQEELGSLVGDLQIILAAELDLVTLALAAAQEGMQDALTQTAEELLSVHGNFASTYRKLLARWLPGHPDSDVPGGPVALARNPSGLPDTSSVREQSLPVLNHAAQTRPGPLPGSGFGVPTVLNLEPHISYGRELVIGPGGGMRVSAQGHACHFGSHLSE
jgi:hypothetical protein